nr:MAG TPA: hypothetical protein [Caudoviricetes sp.]DAT79768.1 MAG TPA: hypothetical protein [Caudoviricetes sp.]
MGWDGRTMTQKVNVLKGYKIRKVRCITCKNYAVNFEINEGYCVVHKLPVRVTEKSYCGKYCYKWEHNA